MITVRFIGGPKDGETADVDYPYPIFAVPDVRGATFELGDIESILVRTVEYRFRTLKRPAGGDWLSFHFYVAEDVTDDEALPLATISAALVGEGSS